MEDIAQPSLGLHHKLALATRMQRAYESLMPIPAIV